MKSLQRFSGVLQQVNQRLVEVLLTFGLPRYGKRMIFVVTLFVGLGRDGVVETDALKRLNDRLSVASNTEALEFPALLSRRIWDCRNLERLAHGLCQLDASNGPLQPEEIAQACDSILNIMPKWMKYATTDKMLDDAKKVVQTTREVSAIS